MNFQVLYPYGLEKALTFSYDDGQIFDRRLVELFNRYKVKATFHLNAGNLGLHHTNDTFIELSEIKELFKGHEISCHGLHHPYFAQLPHDQMVYELYEDKRILESVLDYPVRGMSYPYGEFQDDLITTASALGIEYGRTVEDTMGFNTPSDFMKWHPSCHHNKVFDLLPDFIHNPHNREHLLFYVWGHSFEFERENNWEHMEQFLKEVAFRDDVWYATSIEIKDYISAYRNLKVSVNQDKIYNPSALDLYFRHNGEIKVIKSGEVIKL